MGRACPFPRGVVVAPAPRVMVEVLHPRGSALFLNKSLFLPLPACFWIKGWEGGFSSLEGV